MSNLAVSRWGWLLAAALLLAPSSAVLAKSKVNKSFLDQIAVEGVDVVAYFKERKAVKGSGRLTFRWSGAEWHFKSAANRDAFAAKPRNFAPQFGGYCAFAVSRGETASIDPEAWTIYNGKLYLNYSLGVRAEWAKDIPGNIAKAEKNWPGVLEK